MNFLNSTSEFQHLGHIQRGGSPSCADRVLAKPSGIWCCNRTYAGLHQCNGWYKSQRIGLYPIEEAIRKHNEMNGDLMKIAEILAI